MIEEKSRFEKLETLRKAAWESISNRREFEWKLCIAFWTLLAAFIVALGTGHLAPLPKWANWAMIAFPVLLGSAHTWWLLGVWTAYQIDKLEEGAFREEMRKEAEYAEPEPVVKLRKPIIERTINRSWNWNEASQIAMTWTLVLLAIFILICLAVASKNHPSNL